MSQKLVIGPYDKGLRTGLIPAYIDNESFPTLTNAYQWRGRVKRKRGTSQLGRLTRYFDSTNPSINTNTLTQAGFVLANDGSGNGTANLLSSFINLLSVSPNASLELGSIIVNNLTHVETFKNTNSDGNLIGSAGGTGTVNYATGAIVINTRAGDTITAQFFYFPSLPVMGIEDLVLAANPFPGNIEFDTTYAYNQLTASPYPNYSVSFYKNPPDNTYTNYDAKTNSTPVTWNGQTYQQFWTTNYQNAFWATNGIQVPFNTSNVGLPFKTISTVDNITTGPPAKARLHIAAHGLVEGDFVFVNEVETTTGINFQTGYVTSEDPQDPGFVDVTFPNATINTNGMGGIAIYLTNNPNPTLDCMRWYDGDPTTGVLAHPVPSATGLGWVNFCPPLSEFEYQIEDLPPDQWYLVTARFVLPFKDRLLFLGPVVQSSSKGPFYLQDTVIYSQNGTPFYTASYTNTPLATMDTPTSTTNVFNPILTPYIPTTLTSFQSASPAAYFEDVTGFGGFLTEGNARAINTVGYNEDVLIVGFSNKFSRLIYRGDDILPFAFFTINSEFGSASQFSAVTLDRGVISIGQQGFVLASQVAAQRIDLEIPDQVFEFNLLNNGTERVCAQRDYINEWIYFTYCSNEFMPNTFPNQTLFYNYRDQTWAIFNESYTTYGTFRAQTGYTWQTIGLKYSSWNAWNDEAWDAGSSTLLQPKILAGTSQGFIMEKDDGTSEAPSIAIQSFSSSTITAPDHGLNNNDYIIISGCLGTVGTQVNGKIFQVSSVTETTFILNPSLTGVFTYIGGGLITRLYVPLIQTKQFPTAWGMARKTRIGTQQYLLSTTMNGQVTLYIFLSQNDMSPFNAGPYVPDPNAQNNSVVYSSVLFTCRESTNIGLTPANINLQQLVPGQQQTWHRMNTSLIGDTVQLGITLNNAQMTSQIQIAAGVTISGATNANPCVLTVSAILPVGQLVQIIGVIGMTQLNNNFYVVTANTSTPSITITLDVDSTSFGSYISGGAAVPFSPVYQFSEIELHGIIMDLYPSQMLS